MKCIVWNVECEVFIVQCAVCSVQCGESLQCDSHPPSHDSHALCWEILINVHKEYTGGKEVKTFNKSVVPQTKGSVSYAILLLVYAEGSCHLTMLFFPLSNKKLRVLNVVQFLAIRYIPGIFGGQF